MVSTGHWCTGAPPPQGRYQDTLPAPESRRIGLESADAMVRETCLQPRLPTRIREERESWFDAKRGYRLLQKAFSHTFISNRGCIRGGVGRKWTYTPGTVYLGVWGRTTGVGGLVAGLRLEEGHLPVSGIKPGSSKPRATHAAGHSDEGPTWGTHQANPVSPPRPSPHRSCAASVASA